MKTTEEMIEVMQAHLRGEKVECRSSATRYGSWHPMDKAPCWDWHHTDYRIGLQQRPTAEEKTP